MTAETTRTVRLASLKANYKHAQLSYREALAKMLELEEGSVEYYQSKQQQAHWAGQMQAYSDVVGAGLAGQWHDETKTSLFKEAYHG